VPDPEEIVTAFIEEFEALKQLALAEAIAKASAVVNAVANAAAATPSAPAQAPEGAPGSVQALISQVDAALRTVDALLAQEQPAERAACAAITRAGSPCKNPPVPGSEFCRVHQPV
jgi:hypothetical protein